MSKKMTPEIRKFIINIAKNNDLSYNIDLEVKIEEGIIKDICFDGVACTISTASTSIMSELLKNKSVEEASVIIDNYLAMLHGKEYDEEVLEEANAFVNTSKQANRIKCATLSWNGMKKIIEKN